MCVCVCEHWPVQVQHSAAGLEGWAAAKLGDAGAAVKPPGSMAAPAVATPIIGLDDKQDSSNNDLAVAPALDEGKLLAKMEEMLDRAMQLPTPLTSTMDQLLSSMTTMTNKVDELATAVSQSINRPQVQLQQFPSLMNDVQATEQQQRQLTHAAAALTEHPQLHLAQQQAQQHTQPPTIQLLQGPQPQAPPFVVQGHMMPANTMGQSGRGMAMWHASRVYYTYLQQQEQAQAEQQRQAKEQALHMNPFM